METGAAPRAIQPLKTISAYSVCLYSLCGYPRAVPSEAVHCFNGKTALISAGWSAEGYFRAGVYWMTAMNRKSSPPVFISA